MVGMCPTTTFPAPIADIVNQSLHTFDDKLWHGPKSIPYSTLGSSFQSVRVIIWNETLYAIFDLEGWWVQAVALPFLPQNREFFTSYQFIFTAGLVPFLYSWDQKIIGQFSFCSSGPFLTDKIRKRLRIILNFRKKTLEMGSEHLCVYNCPWTFGASEKH